MPSVEAIESGGSLRHHLRLVDRRAYPFAFAHTPTQLRFVAHACPTRSTITGPSPLNRLQHRKAIPEQTLLTLCIQEPMTQR